MILFFVFFGGLAVIFFILDLMDAANEGRRQADREYAVDRMKREMFYRDMLWEEQNQRNNSCYNKHQKQSTNSCSDMNQNNDQNRNKNKICRKMK